MRRRAGPLDLENIATNTAITAAVTTAPPPCSSHRYAPNNTSNAATAHHHTTPARPCRRPLSLRRRLTTQSPWPRKTDT